jgi:hypothetical protein
MRIFGSERKEVTGRLSELHNEGLHQILLTPVPVTARSKAFMTTWTTGSNPARDIDNLSAEVLCCPL